MFPLSVDLYRLINALILKSILKHIVGQMYDALVKKSKNKYCKMFFVCRQIQ